MIVVALLIAQGVGAGLALGAFFLIGAPLWVSIAIYLLGGSLTTGAVLWFANRDAPEASPQQSEKSFKANMLFMDLI